MHRYYVRLNRQGQPSFLTRKDDPAHTPIAFHDLPSHIQRLVGRVYGEFGEPASDPVGATVGPVVIEWTDSAT